MPTHRPRSWPWAASIALALLSLSCASAIRVYVNPGADLAYYTKIGVMPFNDMSSNPLASPRVTRAFVTELIMTNRFQVIQPEEFVGALGRMGVRREQDGAYDPDKLKDAAVRMGVTGVLRGAVTEYEMTRNSGGDIPILAFDAELVDVNTGDVVWRSSISKRGKGRVPIFGSKSRSLGRLTQDACAQLVARLRRKAI
jgi:curli biogenesis system outer membrane secretion channel CsgG